MATETATSHTNAEISPQKGGAAMNHAIALHPQDGPLLAWHYTTAQHFKAIVESGVLLPAGIASTSKKERPILWFSLAQFWEPTASKGCLQDGRKIDLEMEGTYNKGGGLVRFGVMPSTLVPWPKLALKANIPPLVRVGLEQRGRAKGAVPEHWHGLIGKALPLEDVEAIDVFDGTKWVRLNQSEQGEVAK